METKFITCVQCDAEFEFTVSEQRYYNERGFDVPKRCPVCRKHKSKLNTASEKKGHNGRKKHQRRVEVSY
ncbi:cytochrome C551 [Desulfobacteraceae bacterium SEEP-SAG9]|nr:cytochrome C551 [Desulfobacteraceae bacterium SEEP-SAG9]